MDALAKLIHELAKLPSIGEKTATRLAFHLINSDGDATKQLSDALLNARNNISLCKQCLNFTDKEICNICQSETRQKNLICVVEQASDINAIEASDKFNGCYHVLHGMLSPMDGIGPEQIKIKELLQRMQTWDDQGEIILALNPSVEGEATSLYLYRTLTPLNIKVSKIAYGLPMGGSIEYADRMTLGKAIDNRVAF